MPLNDQQAIEKLVSLYDDMEEKAKLQSEDDVIDKAELRKFKAEQLVAIFKEYIMTGTVQTTVTGLDSNGGAIAGQGNGAIIQ